MRSTVRVMRAIFFFFFSIGLGGRRSFHQQPNLNLATKVLEIEIFHENIVTSLPLPELLLVRQIGNMGETSWTNFDIGCGRRSRYSFVRT